MKKPRPRKPRNLIVNKTGIPWELDICNSAVRLSRQGISMTLIGAMDPKDLNRLHKYLGQAIDYLELKEK